jgi:hypothetical protein
MSGHGNLGLDLLVYLGGCVVKLARSLFHMVQFGFLY